MRRRLYLLTILSVALATVVATWLFGQDFIALTNKKDFRVIVYKDGHSRQIDLPAAAELERITETLFTRSSSATYEGILPDTIKAIKSNGAVEILYSSPIGLNGHNPAISRSSIIVDHLLVPLKVHVGWIVYGVDGYSSGPLITTDLKQMLVLQKLSGEK